MDINLLKEVLFIDIIRRQSPALYKKFYNKVMRILDGLASADISKVMWEIDAEKITDKLLYKFGEFKIDEIESPVKIAKRIKSDRRRITRHNN